MLLHNASSSTTRLPLSVISYCGIRVEVRLLTRQNRTDGIGSVLDLANTRIILRVLVLPSPSSPLRSRRQESQQSRTRTVGLGYLFHSVSMLL
jgi:hypothetical protein